MIKEIDNYFLQQAEPVKSCLLTLRGIILKYDQHISEAWKYRMPFYCYKGKMCCYLWVDKKSSRPYLGIVEGKQIKDDNLVQGDRARMKIILFDPEKDLPIKKINALLSKVTALYLKKNFS
jgi:hypothetical protein